MGQDFSCGVCVDPVTSPATVELIAHNVECTSADIYLGDFETLLGCTTACVDTSDCQYFTYGLSSGPQGNKNGGMEQGAKRADCRHTVDRLRVRKRDGGDRE